MARASIISLKFTTIPVFPSCCVVCSSDQPASSLRLLTRNGLCGDKLQSGWFTVRVPCCVGCGVWLRTTRAIRFIGTIAMAAAWVCFGLFYLEQRCHLPGVACGLIALGGICVCFLVQFFWTHFHPSAFDIEISEARVQTAAGSKLETFVDYKFRDRALALRFANANGLLLESAPENRSHETPVCHRRDKN